MAEKTWDLESPLGIKLAEIDIEAEYWSNLEKSYRERGIGSAEMQYYHYVQNMRDLAQEKRFQFEQYIKHNG